MHWHSTGGSGGSYGCRYIHHIDTPCQNIRPTLAATYTDTVCDIKLKISDILQENKPTEARKTKLQNLNSLMPLSTHQIKSSFISISCVPVMLRNKKEKMMKENNIGTQYRSMSVANSVKIPTPAVVIVWRLGLQLESCNFSINHSVSQKISCRGDPFSSLKKYTHHI